MGSGMGALDQYLLSLDISILAPRMGSGFPYVEAGDTKGISILAPRMGSGTAYQLANVLLRKFQSSLPAWGAACGSIYMLWLWFDFNPRSPHGERP